MPAIGNIALADGKGAPVTHTFSPTSTNGSKAILHNRAASITRGEENLVIEVYRSQGKDGANRVLIQGSFPTIATVGGVETVVRVSKVDIAFSFAQDELEATRKDIRVMIAALLAHATMVTVIEKLESVY